MIDSPEHADRRACVIASFILTRGRQVCQGIADGEVEWRCGALAFDALQPLIDSKRPDLSQVQLLLDADKDEWACSPHPISKEAA